MKSEEYLIAGVDRWKDAIDLFQKKRFLGACYLAGYTAECILKYVIMEHKKLLSYEEVNSAIQQIKDNKQKYKENLTNGVMVEWLDYCFEDIKEFNEVTGKFNSLKGHKIEPLSDLAINATKSLKKTTMSMIKKSAPYCIKWSEQWRYGKSYLVENNFIMQISEEVTEEMALEFLEQVKWLIDQIKIDTNNIKIHIEDIERSV